MFFLLSLVFACLGERHYSAPRDVFCSEWTSHTNTESQESWVEETLRGSDRPALRQNQNVNERLLRWHWKPETYLEHFWTCTLVGVWGQGCSLQRLLMYFWTQWSQSCKVQMWFSPLGGAKGGFKKFTDISRTLQFIWAEDSQNDDKPNALGQWMPCV